MLYFGTTHKKGEEIICNINKISETFVKIITSRNRK